MEVKLGRKITCHRKNVFNCTVFSCTPSALYYLLWWCRHVCGGRCPGYSTCCSAAVMKYQLSPASDTACVLSPLFLPPCHKMVASALSISSLSRAGREESRKQLLLRLTNKKQTFLEVLIPVFSRVSLVIWVCSPPPLVGETGKWVCSQRGWGCSHPWKCHSESVREEVCARWLMQKGRHEEQ